MSTSTVPRPDRSTDGHHQDLPADPWRGFRSRGRIAAMLPDEHAGGVYDVDTSISAGFTADAPGYIDREAELIVGLRTDAPLPVY